MPAREETGHAHILSRDRGGQQDGGGLSRRTVQTPWITPALTEVEFPRAICAAAPDGPSAVPPVLARLD
ncbi:hypothetical protein B1T49_09775 [Mycobacterium persicum]|nr:hypothetical protein B1T49_09775 [Mycobacterium persicum]